jgi:hypothetical protein
MKLDGHACSLKATCQWLQLQQQLNVSKGIDKLLVGQGADVGQQDGGLLQMAGSTGTKCCVMHCWREWCLQERHAVQHRNRQSGKIPHVLQKAADTHSTAARA